MGFWYNAPKEGQKFANLSCKDWFEVNTQFEFEELAWKQDDGFYHLFAYATKFTDCDQMGLGAGIKFKFEPQLVQFKVAKKNYIKKGFQGKPDKSIEQSRVEKWLCKVLSQYDEGVIYHGKFSFTDTAQIDTFLTGIDPNGQKVEPLLLQSMESYYYSLSVVGESKYLKPEDIQIKSNWKGGGSSAPSQTELEVLNDRLAFVLQEVDKDEQLKGRWDGSLKSLIKMRRESEENSAGKEIWEIFTTCLMIMHGIPNID